MHESELEHIAALLEWTKQKIVMTHRVRDLYFYERELWWASLGQNVGFEENGKHHWFERPVIILKKFSKEIFLCIPVTTKIRTGNWYYRFESNGESQCALLIQIRAMSSRRLIRRIGILAENDFQTIRKMTKLLI